MQSHKKVALHKSERMYKKLNGFLAGFQFTQCFFAPIYRFCTFPDKVLKSVCPGYHRRAVVCFVDGSAGKELAWSLTQTEEIQSRTGCSIRSKGTALDSKPQLSDVTSYFLRPVDLQATASLVGFWMMATCPEHSSWHKAASVTQAKFPYLSADGGVVHLV